LQLKDLLDGKFADTVPEYHIIDCRYNFEHEGGHIHGAVNINDPVTLQRRFLDQPQLGDVPPILLFHCEFSHNRAPKMLRFMRNQDRKIHAATYPDLYYPEVYLINKGYKNVFEKRPECCQPQTYTRMLDDRFQQEASAAHSFIKNAYRSLSSKRRRRRSSVVSKSCPSGFS